MSSGCCVMCMAVWRSVVVGVYQNVSAKESSNFLLWILVVGILAFDQKCVDLHEWMLLCH